MIASVHAAYPFVDRLRRSLPMSARARQPLIAYLKSKRVIGSTSPNLRVVNVFLNGYDGKIMCQFAIEGDAGARMFVAPLMQLVINRRHPAAREAAKAINPCGPRLGAAARV
jgi:hypothetical protein